MQEQRTGVTREHSYFASERRTTQKNRARPEKDERGFFAKPVEN